MNNKNEIEGIDTKDVMEYFSFLGEKKIIDPIERHDYREMIKDKFGITEFEFNVKGGVTISWDHLIQTYRTQMGVETAQ